MVPVVRSTFRILEELAKHGPLALNDVTRRSGISKSTVFRILTTLTQLGYLVRDNDRNYYVSRTMGDLVSNEAGVEAIRRAALPQMLKLRDRFGETVNLGQLELDKVVYIEVVPSEYALRFHERPGSSIFAHASGLGKAILAFSEEPLLAGILERRQLPFVTPNTITESSQLLSELKRIHDVGFAFDRGETAALATCVAVPILNEHRHAVAALSISGPTSRFNPRKDSPVVQNLMKAAAEIANTLHVSSANSKPASRKSLRAGQSE